MLDESKLRASLRRRPTGRPLAALPGRFLGSGFRVLGFQVSGFRVWGLGLQSFRVLGLGLH